jgi:SagB-type dehydrogenase family enzyme
MDTIEKFRGFLKCLIKKEWNGSETDRTKGLPAPRHQKPYPESATLIGLTAPEDLSIGRTPFIDVIAKRKSRRTYCGKSLTLPEISFLLWATQGMRKTSRKKGYPLNKRTVPSGGGIHPFETYLLVNRIVGMEPGLYRYLPGDHLLCLLFHDKSLNRKIHEACFFQHVISSAVTFIWTVIPYRAEWRYGAFCHKIMAIDAGHVCQNLYLSCEAISLGACAIGAYDQKELDRLINVDGKDEFTIYAASVGRV